MGYQLYPERFVWFDLEARNERSPNHTDPAFQLPVIKYSEEERLARLHEDALDWSSIGDFDITSLLRKSCKLR